MDALVVSLNFNPGHFSHLVANLRLFADSGYVPHLYVHPSFNRMDESDSFDKINSPRDLRKLVKPKVAVFWFPSLKNIIEMLRLRFFFGAQIVYVYHEPFDSIKNYYRSGFGIAKIGKILLINAVNIPLLLLSHKVVLPSFAAFTLYQKKYARLNADYHRIPLLFDDEAGHVGDEASKEFISYIGTIAADHAFDRFVQFVDAAVSNGWLEGRKFLIATKNEIPERERMILSRHLPTGRIVISEGKPMTTEEINHHYQRSIVVWNAYHRSMQSGVLPKAYMFGAAVIVLRRNANEFIDHDITGVLIDNNADVVEIRNAIEVVCSRRSAFASNCREKFLSTFYYKSRLLDFRRMLGQ